MDIIDVEGVVKFTAGLQQADGSFVGDKWGEQYIVQIIGIYMCMVCTGEVDTRFSFCALATLALLVS